MSLGGWLQIENLYKHACYNSKFVSQDLNLYSGRYVLSLCPSTELYRINKVICEKKVQLGFIIVFLQDPIGPYLILYSAIVIKFFLRYFIFWNCYFRPRSGLWLSKNENWSVNSEVFLFLLFFLDHVSF